MRVAALILFCLVAMTARSATAAAAGTSKLAGIQTHLLWSDVTDAEMRHQLDLVKQSGADLTRVDVGWASIEQDGRGKVSQWYLDRLDAVVDAANARGIRLLLTFMNSPCWASTAPDSLKQGCTGAWWSRGVSTYAPANPQDYANALRMLAARYRGRVVGWEIWNEPNSTDYLQASDPAAAYAAMVKASYPAVKAADPNAVVVAGALSQSDHAFTQRLYDLGIKGYFDAFSIHPYSDDVSPLDPRSTVDSRYSFVRGVPAVHDVMVAHGDNRPMWLTEAGYSTSTNRTADAWRNGVSEDTQALFIRQQMQQVARWDFVAATVWYELNDEGTDRADVYSNCGLRRWDGSAKPAWAAFQDGIADLHSSPAVGPNDPSGGTSPSQPSGGTSPSQPSGGTSPSQPSGGAPLTPPATATTGPAAPTTVPGQTHPKPGTKAKRRTRAKAAQRVRARVARAKHRRKRHTHKKHRHGKPAHLKSARR